MQDNKLSQLERIDSKFISGHADKSVCYSSVEGSNLSSLLLEDDAEHE